jgi:hypothetical protein
VDRRLLFLLVPGALLSGCMNKDCPGNCSNDSGTSPYLRVVLDHEEQDGDYTVVLHGHWTITCTWTVPLDGVEPICQGAGGAAEFESDATGLTSAAFHASYGGEDSATVTRDDETLYDSSLDPDWGNRVGECGCRFEEGDVTISF